jgi:S1-C subfamily serine protease
VCFAVPSNTASFVISQVLSHGRVKRAWLGVGAEEVLIAGDIAKRLGLAAGRGVVVRTVEPGSPAATAGMRVGDVLVRFAGKDLHSIADLHRVLDHDAIDRPFGIDVVRGGELRHLTVRAAEFQTNR